MENVHNHFTVDAISQYLPYNYSVAQSFRQDGYMGWNPYTHNGTAIAETRCCAPVTGTTSSTSSCPSGRPGTRASSCNSSLRVWA